MQLVHEFNQHFGIITGLLLLEEVCEASFGTLPILISSSDDTSIRMFNFETMTPIYRMDNVEPCMGLYKVRKDMIYHFSKSCIFLWNVNKFYNIFVETSATVVSIERVEHINKPARVVALCIDGTIRIMSPVNGAILLILFPPYFITNVTKFLYDYDNEKLYSFTENRHVIIYDTTTNPGLIKGVWNYDNFKITSIVGISTSFFKFDRGDVLLRSSSSKSPLKLSPQDEIKIHLQQISSYFIIAGTNEGQIIYFDKENGESKKIIQAHVGEICELHYDYEKIMFKQSKCFTKKELDLPFYLKCVKKIDLNPANGIPTSLGVDIKNSVISFPSNGMIDLISYKDSKTVRNFEPTPSNINKPIIQIRYIESLEIFISVNTDKTLRVWDKNKALIKEIQFFDSVYSIAFLNLKGDILVGLEYQIDIIKAKDYLPLNFLQKLLTYDITDDLQEAPISFNETIDFWDYFYNEAKTLLTPDFQWHIKKNDFKFSTHSINKEETITPQKREYVIKIKPQSKKNIKSNDNSKEKSDETKKLNKDTEIIDEPNKDTEISNENINESNELSQSNESLNNPIINIQDESNSSMNEEEQKENVIINQEEIGRNNDSINESKNDIENIKKSKSKKNRKNIKQKSISKKNNKHIHTVNKDKEHIKENSDTTVDLTDLSQDNLDDDSTEFLSLRNIHTYDEYLQELEKRRLLIKQFKQPDLILPNSQFLEELFKNGKLGGKTWEECMKGWYNSNVAFPQFIYNQKTKKYEYAGFDLKFRKDEMNLNLESIKSGSNDESIDLKAILGDELDKINNKSSNSSIFSSYDKLRKKKKASTNKSKNKSRSRSKSKSKSKSKNTSRSKKGDESKKGDKTSGYDTSTTNRKQNKSHNDIHGSSTSFKLKHFGSNEEKSNLQRNFGFDSLFDGDLNDEKISDALVNILDENNEIDENTLAQEIMNLDINPKRKKALMEKINSKLVANGKTSIFDKDEYTNTIENNLLQRKKKMFNGVNDPVETSLKKYHYVKCHPLTEEAIKNNKRLIDFFLLNGGDINSLRMTENGEVIIEEDNEGRIFQYELNDFYSKEHMKKKDFKKYYDGKSYVPICNISPEAQNFLKKSMLRNRKNSSDIVWKLIRQWKMDKTINFKYDNYNTNNNNNYNHIYHNPKINRKNVLSSNKSYFIGPNNIYDNNKLNININKDVRNHYLENTHGNNNDQKFVNNSTDLTKSSRRNLKERQSDLNQIIDNLTSIIRSGLWSEKCEASKALLFLYLEFKADLKISIDTYLENQLDLFSDENWKVRAQMCVNLMGYNTFNKQCLIRTIGLLKDESNDVRNIALQTLCYYGISTKQRLDEFIRSIFEKDGVDTKEEKYKSILDEMMDIKKERDRIMKIEENRKILQWIRCVDPNIHIIDTLGFSSQNFELNTSKSLSNNDLDVSNIANMSVYDYNDNDYKSDTDISESSKQVNHKRYNSLLPLENKQVYNVVENNKANSISSRTNSASIVKGSISADNLQKPNNKSDFVVVNTEKEKDKEKEKLKMPLMDLPSTTSLPSLSHQNSQNNFNDKIISLPSVI
ncbi:WD40 repeat-like protein [Neocallimastix lanati (nom. inval.)]|uniref:WD40 repeat-like protein n=1 Tax=Neocallimastix californiae TaxID=1754190 RepID=A0A1Y2BK25_9FUNG|nr:WD40 repeat-like protein [Neocallimastix sp. JGI-2020a]ORY35128.1 WD40 repeat-like protein [Neocallimastix californiae]|eukprot:ORY35128.1 WD40 repeat-like protein [Neocallimastix californiae]